MTTQTRTRYSDDFKRDAVALVTDEGYKISEAARRLGINATMLSRWKQAQEKAPAGSELTSAFFAKEMK